MYRDTHLAQIAIVTSKNRAIPGLHRDSFPGLSGQVQGRLLRQVTFTKLYCRAVSGYSSRIFKPSNPPWLLTFSTFNNDTLTWQFLAIWQLILPALRVSSFLASFFQIPKQMQMALISNMTNTLFVHLHLFSQMVTVPKQQIPPWPICKKNLRWQLHG